MRYAVVLAVMVAAFMPPGVGYEASIGSWYPILQTGNSWVYAEEERHAVRGHGFDNPIVITWTTTETVAAVEAIDLGTLVTIRSTVSDRRINVCGGACSGGPPPKTELLAHGSCVYEMRTADDPDDTWGAYDAYHRIRPQFRHALLRNDVPPKLCFPMVAGGEWGRVPSNPDDYDIWQVKALNGDPFGVPGARTFHVLGYQGSGDTTDYWFQKGVGIVQFVEQHHGTYDEYRHQLVSSTIGGTRRTYALMPARTVPLYASECRAGWRRFVRADGSLIPNYAACVKYAPRDPF